MRYFLSLLIAVFLPSIVVAEAPLAQQKSEVAFKVDGDKIIRLPMTEYGSLPFKDENFEIAPPGLLWSKDVVAPEISNFNLDFLIYFKKPTQVEFVTVEQVCPNGELYLMLEDKLPALKQYNTYKRNTKTKDKSPDLNLSLLWEGRSLPKGKLQWLFETEESTFIFKITIKTLNNEPTRIYLASVFSLNTKDTYINDMSVKAKYDSLKEQRLTF
jgi:hypothetical protein